MGARAEREVLDPQEMRERLTALAPAQKGLLLKQARIHALGTDLAPDELLTEAIIGALTEGGRRCPREVAVTTFLINAMRSIASHRRATLAAQPAPLLECELCADEESPSPLHAVADGAAPPEESVAVERLLTVCAEQFREDPAALALLRARLAGITESEIRAECGLDDRQFEAAAKRLRRFLERLAMRSERDG